MARADDHAGEPRGIEQAFFLVEVPAAVLLRHQPALEPVGEPGDDALQARELAVEIGAQPVELVVVAQLGRLDHLVELVGAGLVVEAVGQVGPRAVGAHGHHALLALVAGFAVVHVLFGGHLGLAVALVVALGHLAGDFGRLLVALPLVLVLAVVLLVALGSSPSSLIVGRLVGFVGQRQSRDDAA